MIYVLGFLLGTAISWVSLLIVIPVAQKLADFSLPRWSETLWKLAIVAAIGTLVMMGVSPFSIWGARAISAIIFLIFMYKWFDVDLFGAIIISVVSTVVQAFIGLMIAGTLMSLSASSRG